MPHVRSSKRARRTCVIDRLGLDPVVHVGARLSSVERCRLRCASRQFRVLDPRFSLGDLATVDDGYLLLWRHMDDKSERWRLARHVGRSGNYFLMMLLHYRTADPCMIMNFAIGAGETSEPDRKAIDKVMDLARTQVKGLSGLEHVKELVTFHGLRALAPDRDAVYNSIAEAMHTRMTNSPVIDLALISAACSGRIDTLMHFEEELVSEFGLFRYAVKHDQLYVILWIMNRVGHTSSIASVYRSHYCSMNLLAIDHDSAECFAHILSLRDDSNDLATMLAYAIRCASVGSRWCFRRLLTFDSVIKCDRLCSLVAGVGASWFLVVSRAFGAPWGSGVRASLRSDPETLAWAISQGCPEDSKTRTEN